MDRMFVVYSGAVGLAAPLAGWSYNPFGSYTVIFEVAAAVILVGVALIATLEPYPKLPV